MYAKERENENGIGPFPNIEAAPSFPVRVEHGPCCAPGRDTDTMMRTPRGLLSIA